MLRSGFLLCTLGHAAATDLPPIDELLKPPAWWEYVEPVEAVGTETTAVPAINVEYFPGENGTMTDLAFEAWPEKRMPMNMGAWPKDATTSRPAACADLTVLEDAVSGWANNCRGLYKLASATTEEACKAACHGESLCSTWQWNDGTGCHVGGGDSSAGVQGVDCEAARAGFPNTGGERIQHGQVSVLLDLKDKVIWKDEKAKDIGKFPDEDGIPIGNARGTEHCKRHCYADITCQFWMYFNDTGCLISDARSNRGDTPTNNQTTFWSDDVIYAPKIVAGDAATQEAFDKWEENFIAGEYIQHHCIAEAADVGGEIKEPTPTLPPAPDHTWVWWVLGLATGGVLAAGIAYYFLRPKAPPKKRAIKVTPAPPPEPKTVTVVHTMPVTTYAAPPVTTYAAPTPAYYYR
eukprot:gnl/TRDRNA2_/TRDRNA2_186596_c0_seq1.p1 gnl/TRDRNA2_/TRDRNA2_186596_c0~~gnl/TRDRNA2_/TRDRNA2_186596_c0_seq1.p1  ORF type:complete len:406 (+),score=75.80 gnl/TRDRNA2_/TRDRNA2_186596_c0_seq1:89-1306(+)